MKRRAAVPMLDMVFFRVLPDEKAAILSAAVRQGVTVSEFTRRALAEAAKKLAA